MLLWRATYSICFPFSSDREYPWFIGCAKVHGLYHSIVVHFLRKVPRGIQRGTRHLEPLIKERIEQEAKDKENWPVSRCLMFVCCRDIDHYQNDAISWLLEVGKKPYQRTIRSLTVRILLMNFAGIHTTTMVRVTSTLNHSFVNQAWFLAIHTCALSSGCQSRICPANA